MRYRVISEGGATVKLVVGQRALTEYLRVLMRKGVDYSIEELGWVRR